MSEAMIYLFLDGIWQTLVMTFISGFFGFIIGLPTGVLLYISKPGQMAANRTFYVLLSLAVNIFRAIPFIILIIWMIPFTKEIVGTSYGVRAAVVALTVGVSPLIARMIENALLEVPSGLVETARSMGGTPWQIITKVLLPEALPNIINSTTLILITLLGYTAMGGVVGAGGLGQIAYKYGYIGYNATIMNTVISLLIVLVYTIQISGDRIFRLNNHR